jgi:acyl-coenzyme A synthetase/AMP-(fatty) acid ligase
MQSRFPLTFRAPADLVFRRGASPVARDELLRHAAAVAGLLPDRPHVVNQCRDRYLFLVGFLAALLRGQISLLTGERAAESLLSAGSPYPGAYAMSDQAGGGAAHFHLSPDMLDRPAAAENVEIPAERMAAIVFTSGSTGEPVGHEKPWGALVRCTIEAARRFRLDRPATTSIVGTVPPQHMYGFETTVLMPLHANAASHAGATFYPQDVALALAQVEAPRVLVTTPLQLRALLRAGLTLPPLDRVVSATAPLAADLAAEAERAWETQVHEIYGATEVGSIATRRTVAGDVWETYGSVGIEQGGDDALVRVAGLVGPVALNDAVELLGERRFRLLGRKSDMIKLAGKRASLAGLNKLLTDVAGVADGVFVLADELDERPTARLAAFVVAPERTEDEIMEALRRRVEAPFLPRRIVKLDRLPRNDTGKLTAAALAELRDRLAKG